MFLPLPLLGFTALQISCSWEQSGLVQFSQLCALYPHHSQEEPLDSKACGLPWPGMMSLVFWGRGRARGPRAHPELPA